MEQMLDKAEDAATLPAQIDIMIDLETASTSNTAAIFALGAVVFDRNGEQPSLDIEDSWDERVQDRRPIWFYRNIRLQSCIDAGLAVDGSTIEWWMQQDDPARMSLFQQPDPVSLGHALVQFSMFIDAQRALYPVADRRTTPVHLWSHATFDEPILSNAYSAARQPQPWHFRDCRDVRTAYDMAYGNGTVPGIPEGNKHNALWDAFRQAVGVQVCYRKLTHFVEISSGLSPEVHNAILSQIDPLGQETVFNRGVDMT